MHLDVAVHLGAYKLCQKNEWIMARDFVFQAILRDSKKKV